MSTPDEGLLLKRAEHLLQAHHAREAEQLVREVLQSHPDSADALSLLAQALLDQGRAGAAVVAARSGLALAPHDFGLRRILVHGLCRLRRADEAREIASSLVEDTPYAWSAHYTLGLAWLGQPYPRARLALASAERARELAPGSPDPLVLIGMCQSRLGDTRAERAAYGDALELDPGHAFALNNLAATDINRGRLRRGGRSLTSALYAAPQSQIAQRNFGILVARITVWFFLVALIGLFAVFLLAFQPWYIHASVATVVVVALLMMAWQALRVLPRGFRNWAPLVWRQSDRSTRVRLIVGGLLVVAVLGFGLAPSFHRPERAGSDISAGQLHSGNRTEAARPDDRPPLLRLAPLGLPICIILVRLIVSATRTRSPDNEHGGGPSGRPYGLG